MLQSKVVPINHDKKLNAHFGSRELEYLIRAPLDMPC